MSDCNETLQELYRYLDGELTVEHRVAVQGHLDGCLDCLQAFDFHAELRTVIARRCRDEVVPTSLLARLESCFGVTFDDAGPADAAPAAEDASGDHLGRPAIDG
jgi:mycothiol system anti-sigma-R factor